MAMSPGCRFGFIYLIKGSPGVMRTPRFVQVGMDHPLCTSALLLPSHPHLAAAANLFILLLTAQLQIPGLCHLPSAHTPCFGLWRAGWRTPPFSCSCCALGVLRFLGRRSSRDTVPLWVLVSCVLSCLLSCSLSCSFSRVLSWLQGSPGKGEKRC